MVETVGEDEEFEFYLKFAKPLVLNLPDTNDRIKAAAWIRYLKADQTDLALRGEYLKLLLFVLQRRKLYGPFSSIPNEGEPLPTFPDDINIQDVAKNFIEIDKKILQATLEKGGYGEWPPFNVAFSSDLTEYATSQEIPGFGVHAYCAFSRDPLPSWNHVERAIFPIGETIDFAKADSPLVDTGSPDISCFISPDKPEPPPPPESPRRSPRIPPGGLSETTPPSDVAPKAPGKSPFKEDEYGMDERVPPIWGSNLVEVKELELDMTPSPVKDLDIDVSEQDMLDFFNDDLDLFEADMDEATSYLQGDFFSPGGRGGPGGPPGSRGVPGSPARPGSPRTPGGPGPSGGLPSTPCPSSQGPCPASDLSGAGQLALVPSQTPPQFVSQLPEGYFTSPHKMFDLLDDLASDRDMLDYYYPSSPRLPEDDPAFFLQGSRLESPEMLAIEAGPSTSRPLSPREEVKRLERQLIPDDESRRVEREATGLPLPPSPARPRTPTAPCAPLLPPSPARSASPSPPCAVVEEGLGGDSFIARDRRDYRWMADTSPGPGIPTDERQDPALWESFGWWTEDPDEIFQYMSPSPRGRGAADEDPFAEEKKRWGDAVRTPPIFSRDPKIREGPAARRQYTPDEFGMESFEEPVWTSAEQYLKYTRDFSPFRDPRDVERKAYDPADYPNIEIPEMDRRLSEIHGAPEEIAFFEDELSPILMDVTLGDTDLQPLTRVEAMMEAIHHGPQFIGVPTPSPEKTPKTPKEDSGEWEDMRFIEETPPLFMLEPPFLATPPEYEPNPQIEVDELDEDTVRKYIEEDIKLINALVPVTTPQRAPSPKRPPPMTAESPPFVPDIDVEPGPYMPSPELVTPERHIVPPQRTFDWDTNIGTPIKLPETNAVVIVSEQDLLAQNIKRKQELAVIYERQFASPPRIPSPPPMPHLMDAPISSRLPAAMTPEKLPPPGWSWQTPERFQPRPYVPQQTRTPTGISPPIPVPREVTMFYESPPEDLYAADFDMDFDLLSPPTPSPPRQPQPPTQMAPMSYWQKDIIERELQEPSAFDLEDVDLPDMPDFPITPERAVSTPIVQEFIKSDIRDLMPELFVTSPQAAAQHEVVVPPPKPPSKLSKGKMKAASGSKLQTPSGRQLKTPSGSRLKTPSGSKIQAPCAGKRKATSASKLPAPGTSKLPAPGTSKLQAPSGSKLQPPCASRIAKRGPPSKLKIPGAKIPKPAPQIPKEEVDELAQEILDLEAELFPDVPRDVRPRRPPPTLPPPEFSPPTPEHQRRLWRQQLEMHDYKPYPKKSFVVQPKPGKSRRVAKYSHRPQLPGIPDSLTSPPPSMSRPVGSPTAQISPERAAWREQVRQHQATPFRRKIFHVRPKHGKAIALRGARRPDLETVADTSPVDAEDLDAAIRELEDEVYKPRSPVGVPDVPSGVTVEQLNEEIMRLEQELALLSTPPRQAPCPGDSPETPPHFREWWKEAIQEGEMEAYPKPRKHYKPPSLETILSPRHPDFAPRQQDRYVQDVRRQAARAVEYDKSLLTQEQERDLYQLPRQHRERAEYQMSDAERAYWQTRRIDIQVPSPPQRPVTPPSLLDEELPEGLPPCLMPPSGWDWRTPERFKQKPYVPHETRTPTGISPPRPVPPELTMFHESPPEDLYDLDMAMLSPPDFSPRTPSPPRAPPQPISIPSTSSQIVPATYWQKDIIEREMQWPGEIEALDDMQIPDIPDMPDISPLRPAAPAAICPAAAAAAAAASPTAAVCGGRTSPKLTEESQALRAEMARKRKDFRPQREFRVKRGSRMAPLPRARPPSLPTIPGSPPGPCGQREQLGREIKDLYERSQLSTPLRRRGGPPPYDPDSPPTPDFARRAYRHWTATHQMVPYDEPRQQLYTPPTLPTILSPGHPEFAERQRQEPVRALERHAQRRVERDIRDIREQQRKKVFKPSKRRTKPKCPCITVTGPTPSPEPIVTPEPPPHLLDEPVPEGQPQALLPPSGWIWKTPERYQPQPYVPKEKPVPTGLSPPRQIPKELTMFHESPPEDLYSPGSPEYDELNLAMLSPPDMSPRAPCPCKTPEGQMVPLGYWQRDAIDRELQEPTDLDDVEMPAIADYEMSPEEPRMITPERAAWRSSVQEHTTVPLRRKIFHVRPRPGRAVALRGAKRPGLATVEDSSPPEPPMAVEGVPEGITVDQLNREIEELEAELEMLRTPPRPKTPPPGDGSPPTPEIERRMWREMVRLHEPLPYTKTVTYSQPPELETIFSQSHPSQAAIARERHIADMRRQAARSCAVDIDRITAEKQKDLYPLPEQHQERVQYEMSDAEREYWRTRRYDVDVPSPPSPAPIPGPPMHLLDEPVPEDLPKGLIRPCGWTYQTPPQMKYRTPEERRTKTPTGIPSPTLPKLPPPGTLFYESPPLISSPESDSPQSLTPSPCAVRSPISPNIPSPPANLDVAMYYPPEYDELDTEPPPELYSSPEFDEPDYDDEIRDLEAEVFGPGPCGARPRRPPRIPPPQEASPPTPDYQRKVWRQELEMRDYEPYPKRSFTVKPKPGKSVRVAKYSHRPRLGAVAEPVEPVPSTSSARMAPVEDPLDAEIRALEGEVFAPCAARTLPIRPQPTEVSPPTPQHQRRIWRQSLDMHEYTPYIKKSFSVKPKPGKSCRVAKYSHRPKMEAVTEKYYEVSPVSPPLRPRPLQDVSIPMPEVTVPPENWTWKTPSPLNQRGIYAESPPLVYSPPSPSAHMPQAGPISPLRPTTPTPCSIFRRPAPPSPLRSPGGRPVMQGLQDRPLDAFERAQAVPQDFDVIDLISPDVIDLTSPDYIDLTTPPRLSPPAPPPRPCTPQAFMPPPRRIPGRRPLDPNVLYAGTPLSAMTAYEQLPETIRFEPERPIALQPTTPEPPTGYYETPVPPATRPWRKQRKRICKKSARRLQFEDAEPEEEEEDENVRILQLQAQLMAQSPPRDVMMESPPDMSPEVEWLGDLVYEPPVFNLYSDEDAPDYNVRPAFEGQPDVDLMDTSPIETIERIPMHLRDFRWMDSPSCGSRCPGKR